MQTELAERFHLCVSDKQAKVASDKNVRLTYQALEFLGFKAMYIYIHIQLEYCTRIHCIRI